MRVLFVLLIVLAGPGAASEIASTSTSTSPQPPAPIVEPTECDSCAARKASIKKLQEKRLTPPLGTQDE